MPQSLVEAMAREKIVIARDNRGASELIEDKKNGFLFEMGNFDELARDINGAMKGNNTQIRKNATKSVKHFSWNIIIKKIESIL